MADLLIFVSIVTGTASFIALFKPLPRIGLPTRKRALAVWASSLVLLFAGSALIPEPTPEELRERAEAEQERAEAEQARAEAEQERAEAARMQAAAEEEARTVTISAADLLREYESNPLRANAQYEGKLLRVNGRINSIGEDFLGTPYITLGGQITNVQAMFSDERALLSLNPGTNVQFTCENFDEGPLGGVLLRDCAP